MTETSGNLAFRPEASQKFVLPAFGVRNFPAEGVRCIVVLRQKRQFNSINLHLYHYAGNNPVKYVDPDGRKSALLTDSDGVPMAGHSAMYVETYDEKGNKNGWDLYEVGVVVPGEEGVLSSETLDSEMGVVAGSVSGTSVSSVSGPEAGLASGSTVAQVAGNTVGAAPVHAGVKKEHFDLSQEDAFNTRISRYNTITEFHTTREEDALISAKAEYAGKNFGKYNLFSNNCSQFACDVLAAGGINTTNCMIPNWAHSYARKYNPASFYTIIR